MGQQEWTGPTTGLGVVKAMAFALGGASPEGVEVVFCVGWTEKLLGQGGPSSPCEWGSGWPLGLLSGEPQALTGLFLHRKARALTPALPLAFPQPQPHSSPLVGLLRWKNRPQAQGRMLGCNGSRTQVSTCARSFRPWNRNRGR